MFYKQYLLTLHEMHCFLFTSSDLFLFHIFKNWFHETSIGQLWWGSGSTLLWWGGVFYHWHCWELLAHGGNKKQTNCNFASLIIVSNLCRQCPFSSPVPGSPMPTGPPLVHQWVNSLKNKYSALCWTAEACDLLNF